MSTDQEHTTNKNSDTGALIKQITELQERVKTSSQKPSDDADHMRQTIEDLKKQLSIFKKTETDNMKKTYESTIVPWFEGCIRDNTDIAEQFVTSIKDAIDDARSKDGVWQIAMAASAKHKELIEQVNLLNKPKLAPNQDPFDDKENRKRNSADEEEQDVFSAFKRRCL